jgi:glycosyltransferase involved in cell wall biosynthesis
MLENTEKIRLAFLIPNLEKGGAERVLVNLVNNLDLKRFQVFIFCLKKKGALLPFVNPSVTILDLDCPRAYFSYFTIRKHLKQYTPHILVSWLGNLNAILGSFMPFLPKSTIYMCRESNIPSIYNKQYRLPFLFNFLYRFMNRYESIICQTTSMKRDLVENFGVKANKIRVIANPVTIREKAADIPIHVRTFLREPGKVMLFVGRFSKEKGIDRLVQVIGMMPAGYKLLIVGYGQYENEIQAAIEENHIQENVLIINDCNDPSPYYAIADCIVMTSYVEGMPNVLLEAFSWGCPAVVYKTEGGVEELITKENGIYIGTKSDITELRDSIISVCENGRLSKTKIIEWVGQSHGVKRIVNEYMDIFWFEWNKNRRKNN